MRRLQVYETILADGSTIMLPPNSDLLRYLESPTFVPPADVPPADAAAVTAGE